MKSSALFALTVLLAAPMVLPAAVFKKAEVTRVLNDVRVLPDQSDAAPAKIGDVITGKTAVATGVSSRAELKFPDNTLTRLGANTLFRLQEGTRDIDLQQGVILLQVPKQLGGARVRTAAVTAAVTGTTILVEYQPDGYIKIIVIEGQVDLFMRDQPSNFITIKAGDMIVMKADAKTFPLPVQVDLDRLLKTSKLLDPDEFGPIGNDTQINEALNQQGDLKKEGELLNTAFMLPGRGTKITLTNEVRREILRIQNQPPSGSPETPDQGSGGRQPDNRPGSVPTDNSRPLIGGTTFLSEPATIVTNPHVTAYNSRTDSVIASRGFYYQPVPGSVLGSTIFGIPKADSPLDLLVNAAGLWAVFHFEDLVILGSPSINSTSGARNLMLASNQGISLTDPIYFSETRLAIPSGSATLTLDSSLDNLMLVSNTGSIYFDSRFRLNGTNQNVFIQTYGASADIEVYSNTPTYYEPSQIELPNGALHMAAGRDILFSAARVLANTVNLNAKRDVNLSASSRISASSKVDITAGRGINITDSTQIRALSSIDPLAVKLITLSGDLSISGSQIDTGAGAIALESQLTNLLLTNSNLTADIIRARSLGPNGELIINGTSFNASTALKLYAEGSNGKVRFTGNSFLNSPSTDIAGKTVTIDTGVSVNVSHPSGLRVYTDNPQFSNNLPNGYGSFTTGESNTPITNVNSQGFDNRPGF